MAFYIDDSPPRSWQSALRQLADTLAPGANIEIDPVNPEVSCARIAEVVQHPSKETERKAWDDHVRRVADLLAEEVGKCSHGVPHRYPRKKCSGEASE